MELPNASGNAADTACATRKGSVERERRYDREPRVTTTSAVIRRGTRRCRVKRRRDRV